MFEPITPVERVLAEVLDEKLADVEQLRGDIAVLRLQLAVALTAHPNPPPAAAGPSNARWRSVVRARVLGRRPARPPAGRIPFPRSPEA